MCGGSWENVLSLNCIKPFIKGQRTGTNIIFGNGDYFSTKPLPVLSMVRTAIGGEEEKVDKSKGSFDHLKSRDIKDLSKSIGMKKKQHDLSTSLRDSKSGQGSRSLR